MSGVRNAFACSFVACRTGLRKVNIHLLKHNSKSNLLPPPQCWQFILCYRPHILANEYQVLCLGLSGSGKSTLLAQLVGENPAATIEPTNGFNIKTLPVAGRVMSIKELGGSDRVRRFWAHYFENKHALIFVLNVAATTERMEAAVETLRSTLHSAAFRGRPCLVIGTHGDRPEARSAAAVEEQLREVMANVKWLLVVVSAFDRAAVQQAMASLAALISTVFPT